MKICEAKICLWSKENMGLPQARARSLISSENRDHV